MGFPPGYRFRPTDSELLQYYLKRKIKGKSIEADCIHEANIYKCNPLKLREKYAPADDPEEWSYFFTPRYRKYRNGERPDRSTPDGFWRASTKTDKIISKSTMLGEKSSLVFYTGNNRDHKKTNWLMQEYKLKAPSHPCETGMKLDDYVLCRIRNNNKPDQIDLLATMVEDAQDAQNVDMHGSNDEAKTYEDNAYMDSDVRFHGSNDEAKTYENNTYMASDVRFHGGSDETKTYENHTYMDYDVRFHGCNDEGKTYEDLTYMASDVRYHGGDDETKTYENSTNMGYDVRLQGGTDETKTYEATNMGYDIQSPILTSDYLPGTIFGLPLDGPPFGNLDKLSELPLDVPEFRLEDFDISEDYFIDFDDLLGPPLLPEAVDYASSDMICNQNVVNTAPLDH